MMNDSQPTLAPLRYWAAVIFIRLLLLTPLALGIAIVVAGVRADSVAITLGGIVLCAIGFMIAGSKVTVAGPMDIEQGANNRPIYRSAFSAVSPDGRLVADIAEAGEWGMGNPTHGQLRLGDGLVIESCSPCFVWSDDSRYLAVPQMITSTGFFGHSTSCRLLVIDTQDCVIFSSRRFKAWLQPESFSAGQLVVGVNTADGTARTIRNIPDDLGKFTRSSYEQFVSPAKQSGLWRFWPLMLGLFLCAGMFFKQLQPVDSQEIDYWGVQSTFGSCLMIVVPMIFWLFLAHEHAKRRKSGRDDSPAFGVALVIAWIFTVVMASQGAIQIGHAADQAGAAVRRYDLEIMSKREYVNREALRKRNWIEHYYVSVNLHGRLTEMPVDQHMYPSLNVGDGISVSEVTGKSGRQYVTLLGPSQKRLEPGLTRAQPALRSEGIQ